MLEKVAGFNQLQAAAISEGLPFWLFWFLLGIIVLLLFFIFLRDKDLRRRIDFFFLSTKNRSLQLHLRRQIKREKKKKERLWLELGQLIYKNKLIFSRAEAIFLALDSLEKKKVQLFSELTEIKEEMVRSAPFVSLPQIVTPDPNLISQGNLSDSAAAISQMNKDGKIKESAAAWKRRRTKLEEKLKDLEQHQGVYFTTLGRLSDTVRLNNEKLQPIYDKIDATNVKLSHLEQQLDSFHSF